MTDTDKPLEFVGSSKDDLSDFPLEVKRSVGFALRAAQRGGKHPDAKPLSGFGGAGVLEVVSNFDGNTFRAVYTVKFKGVVYVLHAFQKKSKMFYKTSSCLSHFGGSRHCEPIGKQMLERRKIRWLCSRQLQVICLKRP